MGPLIVRIKFDSDFAVSTGYGLAGVLHNTVVKTEDGLPYIPGTSVKGVIRDRCEEIARILQIELPKPDSPELSWSNEIAVIFGSPFLPAGFTFSSAYMVGDEQQLIVLKNFLTHGETHNKINPETGTALESHLFSFEVAARDCAFEFEVFENPGPENQVTDRARSLLIAGMLFTEHIGHRKSRGRGRCHLQLANLPDIWGGRAAEEWLDILISENSHE
jgi:CRISPR/Cas system CSM-associated protein Csm3 (group 7 of RAMP superfamily)